MKRCVKCHNKINAQAVRCGMCGRHTSTMLAYRWHILLTVLVSSGAFAGLKVIL